MPQMQKLLSVGAVIVAGYLIIRAVTKKGKGDRGEAKLSTVGNPTFSNQQVRMGRRHGRVLMGLSAISKARGSTLKITWKCANSGDAGADVNLFLSKRPTETKTFMSAAGPQVTVPAGSAGTVISFDYTVPTDLSLLTYQLVLKMVNSVTGVVVGSDDLDLTITAKGPNLSVVGIPTFAKR